MVLQSDIFIYMESLAFGNFKYNTINSSCTIDASVYYSQYEAHRFEDRLASRSAFISSNAFLMLSNITFVLAAASIFLTRLLAE